jgi:PAS domain S-box-containing protein
MRRKTAMLAEPDSEPVKVLLIEDDPGDVRLTKLMLHEAGPVRIALEWVDRLSAGLDLLARGGIDVVLLDLNLPDSSGLATFKRIYSKATEIPILVLTGLEDRRVARELLKSGAQDYLVKKDVSGSLLIRSIYHAMERKQADEAIRQAAQEWRETFDSISDMISILDKDSKITRVNKAFADFVGMKPAEVIGKTCYELVHGTKKPPQECPYYRTLKTKKPAVAELFEPSLNVYLVASTSPIFDEKGRVVGSVHIARDITEQKKVQERIVVSDRLITVGEMASGIAHELNNPLTGVIGLSQLLVGKDMPDAIRKDVETICSEAQRAATIVKNLLTFARKHTPTRQPTQTNNIIEDVLKLRSYEHRINNIQVERQLDTELPEIMADYFQIQQVFLNIILNAEGAMAEAHNQGTLTITTERVNGNIKVSFTDDGPGIPRENLSRLFDPFFTTKEVGKGTGLGLSICYGIVSEHNGKIYAESKTDKGATFIVELPLNGG